jgi:hypothetical protein
MAKVLIIRPEDDPKKGWWTEMASVPHNGEQIYFMGKSYSVSMVKHFIQADDIPEYKKKAPFVRLMLTNQ